MFKSREQPRKQGTTIVTFDQLWAGWRSDYVNKVASEERSSLLRPDSDASGDTVTGAANGPGEKENVSYGTAEDRTEIRKKCVFCSIAASKKPNKESHLVYFGRSSMALLNAYPYGTGHLLIMPIRHVGDIDELSEDEYADVWRVLKSAVAALRKAYDPDGFNIGANLGRAAGAGIPEHLHLHALPRWSGDTSFMTAVAATRVLPESLDITFEKITQSWPGLTDASLERD